MLGTFSKYVRLYSVKRATSQVLSEKVTKDYMIHVGKPKEMCIRDSHSSTYPSTLSLPPNFGAILQLQAVMTFTVRYL